MSDRRLYNSFFDEKKTINANKYNFYSLVFSIFIVIPFMVLFHELTNGFGIGEITIIELVKMSFTGSSTILHVRNILIFCLMSFFVVKSYFSKQQEYIFVDRKKLINKWRVLIIPLLCSIILFFNPKLLQPVTSLSIALLMTFFYYKFTELLLMKFMKGIDMENK